MGDRRRVDGAKDRQGVPLRPGDDAQPAPDAAPGLPGRQESDPEASAALGTHRHRIFPQRRGGGPR